MAGEFTVDRAALRESAIGINVAISGLQGLGSPRPATAAP
jgi:hypothetical protein